MISVFAYVYDEQEKQWQELSGVYPVTLYERLDAELDGGTFNFFSKSDKIYPPFTKCKIVIEGVAKYFYMSSASQWFGGGNWQHTATLTEPTKLLEGYFISGLAVTQPRTGAIKTLYDVLQRIINVTPLRVSGESPIFTITSDPAIVELLQGTYSPEFRWGSQTTLWEVLSDIGAYVDAMPRLVPNAADDGNYNTITFDLINEVKEVLAAVGFSQCVNSVNEAQYCSALETDAENLVASNADEASTVYPDVDSWITPRSEEVQLTDNNCQIILPSKIERLIRVLVNGEDVSISVNWKDNNDKQHQENRLLSSFGVAELDITDLVKEMAEWQTLDTTQGARLGIVAYQDYKNNTWNYSLYNNVINLPAEWSIWGSTTTTQNVLGSAAVRQLSDGSKNDNEDYTFLYNGIRYGINSATTASPINIRFRVEYNALNSASKVKTIKTNKPATDFIQPFNQRAEINNAQAFGRNMQGTVDRMGVEAKELFTQIKSIDKVLKVGSAIIQDGEVFIISTVKAEVQPEVINATYSLSQNWNLISQYVSIDKKFRNWNIPAEVLQRRLYDYDFCVVSDTLLDFSARLNPNVLANFANIFKCSQDFTPTEINNAWMIRSTFVGAVLEVSSFSVGTSILFSAKTKDNLSAGPNREKREADYICRDVYYCNDDGTLADVRIYLAANIQQLDTDLLPGCRTYQFPLLGAANMPPNSDKWFVETTYWVDKDPAEQLFYNYQVHFVSKLKDVVIGTQMAETCPLVRQWNANKSFKVWGLTKQVPHNAVKVLSSWGTVVGTVTNDNANPYFSATVAGEIIQLTFNRLNGNYTGWAITDEQGNLYIAQNKSPSTATTLYLGFVHNY